MYKDYEDVYDKKKIWALDSSIDTESISLHVVIEKLEAIIKIIERNCFHFDCEHGEYILNHTLKKLEKKQLRTKRNIYLNQTR